MTGKRLHLYLSSACAFDSVPADLGVLLTTRHFDRDCCNSISSYLTVNSGPAGFHGHFTTYECAVHGLSDIATLKAIRKKIVDTFKIPNLKPPGPVIVKRPMFFYEKNEKKYAMTFLGADASVVRSTHRNLKEMGKLRDCAPQYSAFMTVPSFFYLVLIIVFGFLIQLLARFTWGRDMLLKYPRLFSIGMFSHEGPTKEQLNTTSFRMTLFGMGFSGPDTSDTPAVIGRKFSTDDGGANLKRVVKVTVEGPEPGYVATPMMLITLAKCLREERTDMPVGGVLTPASAFYNSDTVFKRLNDCGIKFTAFKMKK